MGFAKGELNLRKSLNYPPFCRLLRIVASSEDSDQALHSLVEIKKDLPLDRFNVQLLGPVAAPLAKVKDRWRHHLLIKAQSAKELQTVLKLAKESASKRKHVRVTFDLDPQDML
jgi:primosomal protein N' (replication factor Y)